MEYQKLISSLFFTKYSVIFFDIMSTESNNVDFSLVFECFVNHDYFATELN